MYDGRGKDCGDTEERDGTCEPGLEEQYILQAENRASIPDTNAYILTTSGSIIRCPGSAPHAYRTDVSCDICPGLSPLRHRSQVSHCPSS